MKLALIAVALAALLCGCARVQQREAPQAVAVATGEPVPMERLVEALLDLQVVTAQAIAGNWQDHAFSAECVMKGDGNELKLVFLAPAMRLATITLSRPHALRYERARQIPAAFEPEYLLFDLAIVKLDRAKLAAALGGEFSVVDQGPSRTVKRGATLVATRTRNDDGSYAFTNHLHDYSYTLKDVAL